MFRVCRSGGRTLEMETTFLSAYGECVAACAGNDHRDNDDWRRFGVAPQSATEDKIAPALREHVSYELLRRLAVLQDSRIATQEACFGKEVGRRNLVDKQNPFIGERLELPNHRPQVLQRDPATSIYDRGESRHRACNVSSRRRSVAPSSVGLRPAGH